MKIITYALLIFSALPLFRYAALSREMCSMLSEFMRRGDHVVARVLGSLTALGVLAYPIIYAAAIVATFWEESMGRGSLALYSGLIPIIYVEIIVVLVIVWGRLEEKSDRTHEF